MPFRMVQMTSGRKWFLSGLTRSVVPVHHVPVVAVHHHVVAPVVAPVGVAVRSVPSLSLRLSRGEGSEGKLKRLN